VSEHKKALEEAEKIEQEFMTLVTGQRRNNQETKTPEVGSLNMCILQNCIVILSCADEEKYVKSYCGKYSFSFLVHEYS